jgi:hypothetical protein
MRAALSRPPHTQPVSSDSTSGWSISPSVDQWPNAIGVPALRRDAIPNHGA